MAEINRSKAAFKFCFWLVVSVALFGYTFYSYSSGQMIQWYYYTAKFDGYAVDANQFHERHQGEALGACGPEAG